MHPRAIDQDEAKVEGCESRCCLQESRSVFWAKEVAVSALEPGGRARLDLGE